MRGVLIERRGRWMRPCNTRLPHGEGLVIFLRHERGEAERLVESPDGVGLFNFLKVGRGLAGGLGEEEEEWSIAVREMLCVESFAGGIAGGDPNPGVEMGPGRLRRSIGRESRLTTEARDCRSCSEPRETRVSSEELDRWPWKLEPAKSSEKAD